MRAKNLINIPEKTSFLTNPTTGFAEFLLIAGVAVIVELLHVSSFQVVNQCQISFFVAIF